MNNTRIELAKHPGQAIQPGNFLTRQIPCSALETDEVMVEMRYLGLEPSARPRMNPNSPYSVPITIGDVIFSTGVGQVVESCSPSFKAGDWVFALSGWQTFFTTTADQLRPIDINKAPPEKWLSLLGLSAFTGYTGIKIFGKPKPGQTVLVSAAAGATGAIAGQVAKLLGANVCGVAGGQAKCEYVTKTLGFDYCVDYRQGKLQEQIREACPEGIDINFENVGGEVLASVLPLMNEYGTVILCGLVAQYASLETSGGPNLWPVVYKSLRVQGFLASRYWHQMPEFIEQMLKWESDGKITHTEEIYSGIHSCPQAFVDLLAGRHLGKVIVAL